MNKIQEFFNEQFGTVRTVVLDGQIYFVGIDISKALGYSNAAKAVSKFCNNSIKLRLPCKTHKGKTRITQNFLCINTTDLFVFIEKSKRSSVETKRNFIRWLSEIGLIDENKFILESREEVEFFEELEKRIDLFNMAFIEVCNMQTLKTLSENEIKKMNPLTDVKLEKQKWVCEEKYRLDGYIEKFNLGIEFDEEQHKYQVEEDNKRTEEITEWFKDNCNSDFRIIRVDKENPEYYIELIMQYMTIAI